MHIGGYFIDNPIALAPMAGITDKPFRRLCRDFGAGWAVCEMLTSDPTLRNTRKTLHRSDFADEGGIVAVQIAGSDPQQMADAARYNVSLGAQLIDINMGCPAKKVCN
ncbi:tRNA-dihydrouridine synthase, partial [Neisseria meningitidis]